MEKVEKEGMYYEPPQDKNKRTPLDLYYEHPGSCFLVSFLTPASRMHEMKMGSLFTFHVNMIKFTFNVWKKAVMKEDPFQKTLYQKNEFICRHFRYEFFFLHSLGHSYGLLNFRVFSTTYYRTLVEEFPLVMVNLRFKVTNDPEDDNACLDCRLFTGFWEENPNDPRCKQMKFPLNSAPPFSIDTLWDKEDLLAVHGRMNDGIFKTFYLFLEKEKEKENQSWVLVKWRDPFLPGTGLDLHYDKQTPDKGCDEKTGKVYKFRWYDQIHDLTFN